MDPPYDYSQTEEILNTVHSFLKQDGLVIVETDKFTKLPEHTKYLDKIKEKQYGFSKIHTYKMSS